MKVLFISLVVVVVDQASKLLVKGINIHALNIHFEGLSKFHSLPLFGNFFFLSFVENPGIAFGIDFGGSFKLLISLFTIAATIGLLVYLYLYRNRSLNFRIALALIIGGALGNLTDRIFYGVLYGYAPLLYGNVVDFFDFRIFNLFVRNNTFGNYIFNVADIAVSTGVLMLLFVMNKENKRETAIVENLLADNKE